METNASKNHRRRGAVLEHAILEAAWDILQEKGYAELTMEGVAARAKTTKTVLYRRWPQKSLLVITALAAFGPRPDFTLPDTGSLRADLTALYDQLLRALNQLGLSDSLKDLIVDRLHEVPLDKVLLAASGKNKIRAVIDMILRHADRRGEVAFDQISERARSLPTLLLVNEFISHGRLTKEATQEIIDSILMPVFLRKD